MPTPQSSPTDLVDPPDPADASEPPTHDWQEAGEAWGHAANDWSCLFEHYALEVVAAILGRLGVGPGTTLLDVACGSGFALRCAGGQGAASAGIDASGELMEIARARNPEADLHLGSMFELPWPDRSFDAVMSINGIWGGNESALAEMFRVLRPGGGIGISYWGAGPPLDLRSCFRIFAREAPSPHRDSMKRLNRISEPGLAEEMLRSCGFEVVDRGSRISIVEWPDAELAWRAVSSLGPAVPALRQGDAAAIKTEVLAAIESTRDARGIYRFRNDHRFVVGRKPA